MKKLIITTLIAIFFMGFVSAQELIKLPEPQKTGGMPLMEALAKRTTARAFSTQNISMQQLSNIVWAAFGINRSDGKRTAPSTRNFQGTDIYVLLKEGVYVYDAKNHQLKKVLADDLRTFGGTQPFVKDAPVQIILVADMTKLGGGTPEDKMNIASIDAGYISQNIYLSCTSEGLVTGARGSVERKSLHSKMMLSQDQTIILAHCIGFPK